MLKEIIRPALKAAGHYFDYDTNTLYMTPAFQKSSNIYGTKEYHTMNELLDTYPDATLEVYKNKRHNMVTYEMMERFIRIMPDAAANFVEYKRIKLKSHAFRSSYKFVTEWFEKKFPYYGEFLIKDDTGNLTWNVLEAYDEAHNQAEAKNQENLEEGDAARC